MVQPSLEEQFPELYRQTIRPLYAYVSRRCGGERALAEDVVQETWLRALDAWKRDGLPAAPAAWLTTVAQRLLINHFRKRKPVGIDAVSGEAALAVVDDGLASESGQVAGLVQWGLAQLPDAQADLLSAFHLDERPVATIALDLRLSERAVEGRLRRARINLRRVIERAVARGRR